MAVKARFIEEKFYQTEPFSASWPRLRKEGEFEGKSTGNFEVSGIFEPNSKNAKQAVKALKVAKAAGMALFDPDDEGEWACKNSPVRDHREAQEEGDKKRKTGCFQVSFKQRSKTRDGVNLPVKIYDKYGNIMPPEIDPWGGSMISVKYTPIAYDMSSSVNGIKFKLVAVKVLELVAKGSGSAEEGGEAFEFEEQPADYIVPVSKNGTDPMENHEEDEEDLDF